jgi:hypothetical protein
VNVGVDMTSNYDRHTSFSDTHQVQAFLNSQRVTEVGKALFDRVNALN